MSRGKTAFPSSWSASEVSRVPFLRRCPAEVLHSTVADSQRQKPRETLEVLNLNAQTPKIWLHSIDACLATCSLALALALDAATYRASRTRFACASLHSSLTCLTNSSDATQVFKPNVLREGIVSDRMTSRANGFRHRGCRGCCFAVLVGHASSYNFNYLHLLDIVVDPLLALLDRHHRANDGRQQPSIAEPKLEVLQINPLRCKLQRSECEVPNLSPTNCDDLKPGGKSMLTVSQAESTLSACCFADHIIGHARGNHHLVSQRVGSKMIASTRMQKNVIWSLKPSCTACQ